MFAFKLFSHPYKAPSSGKKWGFSKKPIAKFSPTLIGKNYALIISGGRSGRLSDFYFQPFPEHASYLATKELATQLIGHFCNAQDMTIFFGDGSNPPQTTKDYRLWTRPYHYFTKNQLIITHNQQIPNLKVNNIQSIENEFNRLSSVIKNNDKLIIYLEGHGQKFAGTVLWNKFISKEIMGPAFLSDLLAKIDPDAKIILFVSSCSSGNFLKLNRPNLTVLTDTSLERAAWYKQDANAELTKKWLHYLINDHEANLLLSQAQGSLLDGNYYASDSLSQYLEQRIKKMLPIQWIVNLHENYQYLMFQLKGNKKSFIAKYTWEIAILLGIIFFPVESMANKATSKYLDVKKNIFILKFFPIVLKAVLAALFASTYEDLHTRFSKTSLYKNYPSWDEKLIVYLLNQIIKSHSDTNLSEEAIAFIKSNEQELIKIMSKLYELQHAQLNEPIISRYTYLFEKSLLFITTSLHHQRFSDLTDFINIAKRTIDPLEKNVANEEHKKEAISRIRGHSIFSKALNLSIDNDKCSRQLKK